MAAAVELCGSQPHGPVLAWMALVLRTLGQSLGLAGQAPVSPDELAAMRAALPDAPHAALARFVGQAAAGAADSDQPRLEGLRQCLSFNFH